MGADAFGETALMEAAGMGDNNLCKQLLDARAAIKVQNAFELTAVDFAEDPGVAAIFHQVLQDDDPLTGRLNPRQVELEDEPLKVQKEEAGEKVETKPSQPSVRKKVIGEANADIAYEWKLTFDKLRAARRGEAMESDLFKVRGLALPVRLVFYPKGSSNVGKGYCSIAVKPSKGAHNMKLWLQIYGHNTGCKFDQLVTLVDNDWEGVANFDDPPQGDVRIIARHWVRTEAGSRIGCLEVRYCAL